MLDPWTTGGRRVLVRRNGGVCLEKRESPSLARGQARIAIRVAGLCRTDLHAADGSLGVEHGRILGHEACGQVLESRAHGVAPGTRVAIVPFIPCEECAGCAAGLRCVAPLLLGVDRDGLFADEVVLPSAALLAVPDKLDDRSAAFVEPTAAALAVHEAALPLDRPGIVVGGGRIAELVRRVLVSLGARRIAMFDPAGGVRAEAVDRAGEFYWAVETTPTERALHAALTAVRSGGIVVLKSRPPRPLAIDVALVAQKRLTLRGVHHAPFEQAVRWLAEHDVADLFDDPLALERHEEAFSRARDSEAKKVFLRLSA